MMRVWPHCAAVAVASQGLQPLFNYPSNEAPEILLNPLNVNLVRGDGRALWRQGSGAIILMMNVLDILSRDSHRNIKTWNLILYAFS
jgi:hypothetical protein